MENKKDNNKWEIDVLSDLNKANVNSEINSVDIISKIDDILDLTDKEDSSMDDIKNIAIDLMTQIQYTDLNRQKIERAMNIIINNSKISEDELSGACIKKAPDAKHIDSDDGEAISDESLMELIAQSKV